ncbi:uncharacterized protein LOC132740239 [Ruditapes philippinarum]|uniref:uncharacterized protein LOC132740239 n=1 Tax=Ruditapes philippinarum TaxID=129788 RepID=UPI00295B9AD4|nr:uncharacterized protein LOC132740239 [Ruditapes philippinarum]
MEKSEDMLKKEDTDSRSASKETGDEGVSDMEVETTAEHDVVRKEAENLDDKKVEKETLDDEVKTSDVIDKESKDSSGVEDVDLTKKSEDSDIQEESVENKEAGKEEGYCGFYSALVLIMVSPGLSYEPLNLIFYLII